MWRRIYRQRRRLGLGLLLFMLIGVVLMPAHDPRGLLVALVFLPAAVTAVFALVVAIRPRWGLIVEVLGITILLYEMLFASAPVLERAIAEAGLAVQLTLFFFTYYMLINLGASLNRLRWPWAMVLRARRVIGRPPGVLWNALRLEPGVAHWDPAVAGLRPVGGAGTVELVPASAEAPIRAGTTERVLTAAPGRFRHSLRQIPNPERPDRPVTTDERIRLAEHARGTTVQLARTWRNVPLLTAIELWLEDQAGDTLDDFAAVVEARRNWSVSALRRRPRRWRWRRRQAGVTKPTAS